MSKKFPHIAVSELTTNELLVPSSDGFTPSPELYMFAKELQKSMRGVQVKIYEDFTGTFRSSMRKKRGHLGCGVGVVYYPEEAYVRGFITHSDLRNTVDAVLAQLPSLDISVGPNTPTFNVHSPHIYRDRLDIIDISKYTTKAKSLKTGVANARKFLQVYDARMIFAATAGEATDVQECSGVALSKALDDAVRLVTGARYGAISDRLSRELKHLHKTQHKFVDAAYADDVLKYIQAEQEVADFRNHVNKCFYMVTVAERLKQPWFGVSHIPPSSTSTGTTLDDLARDNKYENLIEKFKTLPEMSDTLLGKMSVLSVMPICTYVKEVGIKINDNVYFLYGGDTA